MTNELMTKPMEFEVNGEEVKLTGNTVREYLVNGNGKVSDQEVVMFMQLCKYQKLNPFLNEAYLVKFGSSPASIIVSKEAFMKRANANPHFQGFEAGIIVARGDEIINLKGAVKLPKDQLIGAWATVKRDDRDLDTHVEIEFSEFSKSQATWKSMPNNMIRKSAIVNALREAFPETLGDMYTEDDKNPNESPVSINNQAQETEPKQSVADLIKPNEDPKPAEPQMPQESEEPLDDNSNQDQVNNQQEELNDQEQADLFAEVDHQ